MFALRFGRALKDVIAERERRRIKLNTPPRGWTAREIKLLGRYTDAELARRLRRPRWQVRNRRIEFKIPPLHPRVVRHYSPKEDRLLGTKPDHGSGAGIGAYQEIR